MKKWIAVFLVLTLAISLAGCAGSKSYIFGVGDQKLTVRLDTAGGYDMVSDKYLEISRNGEQLTQCVFMDMACEDYLTLISLSAQDYQVLETGEKDGNAYTFFQVTEEEAPTYGYAIRVADAGFTVILSNKISQESARTCFDRLSFTLE